MANKEAVAGESSVAVQETISIREFAMKAIDLASVDSELTALIQPLSENLALELERMDALMYATVPPFGVPRWRGRELPEAFRLPPPPMAIRAPRAIEVPPVPAHAAISPANFPDGCDEEYRALARELGVGTIEMQNGELEQFLADNFIEVYPLEKVVAYMDALCKKQDEQRGGWGRTTWDWYPLRDVDVDPLPLRELGNAKNTRYAKPVPMPVLQTVKRIADVFKDSVRFCVTDCEVKDPFLLVGIKTPGGVFKIHVIERWDEPSFRS